MSYRILIVDHDELNRLPVERALRAAGFDASTASGRRQALERIARDDLDLVLTEEQLPHVDGLRLAWQIKAEFPSVAVIVMTSVGSTRSAAEAMRLGVEDYLVRPFDAAALIGVARRAIESPARGLARPAHGSP